jgi:hypothetical protein
MDLETHFAIADKLEAGKSAGWLTEYLVSWHGPSGHLLPAVTVWREPDRSELTVRAYLIRLLADLVAKDKIEIAGV